ncbi:hypothetical protein [Massilia puerhi]|uniref:hypothetical protein n=1 Tax=Massilia puerhi TaxID=2681550 RepID=UPI00135B86DB|nr:hypothetical protein [Massilia puerhi]
MSASLVLHIVCPTQKRGFAACMSFCFVCLLAYGLASGARNNLSPGVIVFTACALAIVSVAAWALYRNFVFRDELYIAREGELPPIELAFLLDEIRAVRLLPAPEAWTPEAKWEALGFGHGRIEIETATHRYHFGAGLDERAANDALQRINGFCLAQRSVAVAA